MTALLPEERIAELADDCFTYRQIIELKHIKDAIRLAVAETAEACAKIAQECDPLGLGAKEIRRRAGD